MAEEKSVLEDVISGLLTNPAFLDIINKQIIKSQGKLSKQVDRNEANIVELFKKVNDSSKELDKYRTRIEQLKNDKQKLTNSINNMEQYTRRNSIRVFGVKEEEGESTNEITKDLCRKHLGITLSDSDIDRSHRVGPAKDDGKRAIIIKFARHDTKHQVMKARRKLKGTTVVIKQDLTKDNNNILKAAVDSDKISKAWSWDGRIFAVKNGTDTVSVIHAIADINKL